MMTMKKIFTILLICILAAGFCFSAGCVQETEKVKLTIKSPALTMNCITDSEISDSTGFLNKAWNAFAAQYTKYDVSADIIEFAQTDYDKYVSGMYDTENAADILYADYFNMATYIHDGYAVPLDDIITDDIRADVDQGYWDASTASENGKTYMLPFTNRQNIVIFNEDLFRAAGLEKYCGKGEVIQSWSLDEWNSVLAALKENLPKGTYPMFMYAKNNQGDTHIMILLRSQVCKFFDENGRFNVNTPEGIAALQWIKDNYDAGYYIPKCEDIEILDCTNSFTGKQLAMLVGNAALIDQLSEAGINNIGYVNFPSSDGSGYATSFVTGFMAFDNGDAKKLEAAKDFLKYIFENEEWLAYSAGGIPCSKKIAAQYNDAIQGAAMYIANSGHVVDYTANNPNWLGVRAAFWPNIHALLKGEMTPAETAAAIDASCNAAIEEGYAKSRLHE